MRVEYDLSGMTRGKYAGKDIRIIGARQSNPDKAPTRPRSNREKFYALCVNNDGYEASLELRKLYRLATPETGDPADCLRVIDESGEDYLFSSDRFVLLTLPRDVENIVEETFAIA